MDFEIVKRQIRKAYQTGRYRWSLDDYVRVFELYYCKYADFMGHGHPGLKTGTVGRVMAALAEDVNGVRYSPEDYLESDIFDCYFMTRFNEGCDYSIVHFTSGDIRTFKSYEAVI